MCITLFTTTATVVTKKVRSGADFLIENTISLPFEGFLSGCIGGILGKGVTLTLPEHPLTPLGQMVTKGGSGSATIIYRYSPYWGLRLAIYSNSVSHYGTMHADTHPLLMAPYFAATGAWTEFWMRAITNPFNKIRYTRDLGKRSTVGQIQHIWKETGALGFFNDTFKYRAELPKMGILFGTYHSLRNTTLQLCSEEPSKAPLPLKAAVDFMCGGIGGAAAAAIGHQINASIYGPETIHTMRTQAQMIKTDAPVAAVAMCVYGLMMHFIQDKGMIDGGLSGWHEIEEFHTEYGGNKARSLNIVDSI